MQKLIKIGVIILFIILCISISIYIKNYIDIKDDIKVLQKDERKLKKSNDSLDILLQSDRKIRVILFKQKDSLERLLVKEKAKVKQDKIDAGVIPLAVNKLSIDSTFKLFNYLYVQDSIASINK